MNVVKVEIEEKIQLKRNEEECQGNINLVEEWSVLACLDGYMNIALEQSEEYLNGQLKNKYGDAFIRGNNVLYISTQKRRGG
ncbi:U6 snRNA-associated Sm-like protein LSm6 [Armadillidium nasatum]|uniref:U6 snRNA-associated Sm-like protein LSm6 n=1 Tax=Armadillidium nasatum TaxID=96803 RepID=A0A5N5T055_9CRUS|nr:U6 snRNA-associated Sm-like protein LSm6 [Armadillidium nasatum]